MTDDMHDDQSPRRAGTQRRRRPMTAIALGVGVLLLLGLTAVVTALVVRGSDTVVRDQYASSACTLVQDSGRQPLIDAVVSQLKAIQEAKRSDIEDLRAAANTASPDSDLPSDDPRYRNPGDVQVSAIAEWCRRNPS